MSFKETFDFVNRIQIHFEKYSFGLYAVEILSTKEFIGYTGFPIPRFDSFDSEMVMKRMGMIHKTYFDHPLIENNHPLCKMYYMN